MVFIYGNTGKKNKKGENRKRRKGTDSLFIFSPPHVSTEVINGEMGLFLLPIKKTAKS